jgi:hypothetical protein
MASTACAAVLDLKDATPRWCARPENQHAFCEDFDHADPIAAWQLSPAPPVGADRSIVASDKSAPNALSTSMEPLSSGEAKLTGLATGFQTRSIDHVVVGLEVRVVQAAFQFDTTGTLASGIGFLLIEDTSTVAGMPNACMGLVLAPSATSGTVRLVWVAVQAVTDCFTVSNLMIDAGGDGGVNPMQSLTVAMPMPLATILTNQWQHVTLELTRNAADGSGTMRPTIANAGAFDGVPIPAGLLQPGFPQVGIASSVTGPAGNVQIEFDNVTVDF